MYLFTVSMHSNILVIPELQMNFIVQSLSLSLSSCIEKKDIRQLYFKNKFN